MNEPGYIYEFYDNPYGNGTPLYIGKTKNLRARMNAHFNGEAQGNMSKDIYDSVELIRFAQCNTYGDAGILERYLIGTKKPKKNVSLMNETVSLDIDIAWLKWETVEKETLNRLKQNNQSSLSANIKTPTELLGDLTSVELSALFAVISLMDTMTANIDMVDIKEKSKYTRSIPELAEVLRKLDTPLFEITVSNDSVSVVFHGKQKQLRKMNACIDMKEINGLNSKYAKTAYYHLSTYRDTGVWSLGIEEFIEIMALGKSYKPRDIRRQVIEPIGNECSKYFEGLTYFEKRGKKKSIERIMFKFDTNETSVQGEVKRQFLLEQLREGDWIKKEFAA